MNLAFLGFARPPREPGGYPAWFWVALAVITAAWLWITAHGAADIVAKWHHGTLIDTVLPRVDDPEQ